MSDNPTVIAVMIAAAAYAFWVWRSDLQAAKAGTPNPKAFPGATPWANPWLLVAVAGSLVLLGLETWGEYALGVSGEQKNITVLFGLYTLAAGFLEELIFRGYLVVEKRGRAALWLSVVGFSLLFALMHDHLWSFESSAAAWKLWEGTLTFTPTTKGWFSTGMIFLGSLWFYVARFGPANPTRSLAPAVAAHVAKNLGVFAIKAVQGHVSGLW